MKIVVIGGTGLIGSKVVTHLRGAGHQVIVGSPSTGINTLTGEGLAEAMENTDVVVDLSNSPSFEDKAVMDFFQTSGKNLLAAELNAGVKHHIGVSIVNTDKMPESGYMRAKVAQEALIQASGVPYSIVRSTQFFEFLGAIAQGYTQGNEVHVSAIPFQPIAAADVSAIVAQTALAAPVNGHFDIAGSYRDTMDVFVSSYLQQLQDPRQVIANDNASYFGATIRNAELVPAGEAKLGATSFEQWLKAQAVPA
jgi:uncharacterized protein YbjT (DUF2867 family)